MHRRQHRGLLALVALAVAIGLLLLVSQASGHGGALPLCFVLPSILLFGLVEVPRSLWPLVEASLTIRHQLLERASLFQRPPPFA